MICVKKRVCIRRPDVGFAAICTLNANEHYIDRPPIERPSALWRRIPERSHWYEHSIRNVLLWPFGKGVQEERDSQLERKKRRERELNRNARNVEGDL